MTDRDRHTRRAADVALLVLTLLGLALRCYGLRNRGLWWDEACVWSEAFTKNTAYQEAPLNTWLTRLLMELIRRDDTLALHLPAMIFGTLHIPAAYRLGQALAGRVTGLVLALLVTLSPSLIYFAQEARPYSLLILLTTLQLTAALRLLEQWDWRRLTWLAVWTTSAIATHLLAPLFSVGIGLALTLALLAQLRQAGDRAAAWRRLAALFVVGAAAIALGVSWTLFRPSFAPVLTGRYLYGPLAFVRFVLAHATTGPGRFGAGWTVRDAIAAVYLAWAVAGAVVLVRRGRAFSLLVLLLAPAVMLLGLYVELGDKSGWDWSRYATPATIPLYALAATAATAARRPSIAALLTLALVSLNAHPVTGLPSWARDARMLRGRQYSLAAADIAIMEQRLSGIIFVMQRSIYADETSRGVISYEQFRRDELPQFHTYDGRVSRVRLERGPGRVPIPILEDEPVTLGPGDYAVFDGWDKRGCAAYVPGLQDSPFPAQPGAFRLCRVP